METELKLIGEMQYLIFDNYQLYRSWSTYRAHYGILKSEYMLSSRCVKYVTIQIFDITDSNFKTKLLSYYKSENPFHIETFEIKDVEFYYIEEIDMYLIDKIKEYLFDKKLYNILHERYPSMKLIMN